MIDFPPQRILVIKLSALGDFVLSIASFQAIRAHHAEASITLLTTAPYRRLARSSGCFDDIWLDERPQWWNIDRWLLMRTRLKAARFNRVYDLQRSDRSAAYFNLMGKKRPEWVGVVKGASHRYEKPRGHTLHIADRESAQLALAGIRRPPIPDLSFLTAEISRFALSKPYALLVPGGAPHRPAKRWPVEHYAKLASTLVKAGVTPVLLGSEAEAKDLARICKICPSSRNLCGDTELEDIALLARDAVVAIGNDTGPMHLIATSGAPSVALFSAESDPEKVAPRGHAVTYLHADDLADLSPERVIAATLEMMERL